MGHKPPRVGAQECRKPCCTLPRPRPVPGGDLRTLRPLVNVTEDRAWVLAVSWLLASVRPCGPYPIVALFGEQGAAKSATARFLRSVVDPAMAPLRCEPRDVR